MQSAAFPSKEELERLARIAEGEGSCDAADLDKIADILRHYPLSAEDEERDDMAFKLLNIVDFMERSESDALLREIAIDHLRRAANLVRLFPAVVMPDGLDDELAALAAEWKNDPRVQISGSIVDICMHPAYQRIIGKGPAAILFILRELQREPDHWFWALRATTGENPVPEEHAGRLDLMAEDWLEWGRKAGHLA
jgi:hypothetical protein